VAGLADTVAGLAELAAGRPGAVHAPASGSTTAVSTASLLLARRQPSIPRMTVCSQARADANVLKGRRPAALMTLKGLPKPSAQPPPAEDMGACGPLSRTPRGGAGPGRPR